MATHMPPPCPSISGFPSNLISRPGILGQGGGHVCGHPWTIPGWISYLGIPRYLDKGGTCVWPSLDNPGMAKLLGNPGILGQGGVCVWPSLDNPGMVKLLGNPGILRQGGDMCVAIPGQSREVTWELGKFLVLSRCHWT